MDVGARANLCEKPTIAERTKVSQLTHSMLEDHQKVDDEMQERAMEYLNRQVFSTPEWMNF